MRKPISPRRSFSRAENGNAMVEFALIVPVLLIMLIGLVDVGRVIDANARLNNGVTAALRYALADAYAESNITAAALNGSGYDAGEANVSYTLFCQCPDGTPLTCSSQCDQGYKRIFVQVDMDRTVTTLFSYPAVGESFPVSRSGFMQIP